VESIDDHRVAALLRCASRRLAQTGTDDGRTDARLLLQAVTGLGRADLLTEPLRVVDAEAARRFERLLRRRLAREPMAYILGEREFWGLPFAVETDVLIPRPETETLIEAALDLFPDRAQALRILDLGVGSGCLLLSLLHLYPEATGSGVDNSPAALRIAAGNAARLEVAQRAALVGGGWAAAPSGPFDLIVSNPPYIAENEVSSLEPEVREHEPRTALIAGPSGLEAYRDLLPEVPARLAPGGALLLEVGRGQADDVAGLARKAGLTQAQRRRDLAGVERCLVLRAAALGR
jgi:release factor glutamine methyltransferase